MNTFCTVQLFKDQHWQDAAIVTLLGNITQGWQAATRVDYLLDHALAELERQMQLTCAWLNFGPEGVCFFTVTGPYLVCATL